MSRIGKQPITIPEGVTVTAQGSVVTVKGKLGETSRTFTKGIVIEVKDGLVQVTRESDTRLLKSCHGLTRTLISNMIEGVTNGYRKSLVISGTGFKAALQGQQLMLSLGFASPKEYVVPEGITATVDAQGVKVTVEGVSKELVGNSAARIRSYYPAEPYKGKGIKYEGEEIRRKQGKTVA